MRVRTWSARIASLAGATLGTALAVLAVTDEGHGGIGAPLLAAFAGAVSVGVLAIARSLRVAGVVALVLACVLFTKPFVFPEVYVHEGVSHTLGVTSETHLAFLIPGLLLLVLAMLFFALPRPPPQPLEIERAALAAVLLLLLSAGIVLVFVNTRGDAASVALLLGPALGIAAGAVLTVARDDGPSLPAIPAGPAWSHSGAPTPMPTRQLAGASGVVDSAASFYREIAAAPPRAMPLLPESRIGRFRLAGRIGEGGMGTVYRAYDDALQREVAVKVLQRIGDLEHKARFLREAEAAARVQHPNVVTLFEIGEDAGAPFLAMELVPGESLRALVAARASGASEATSYVAARAVALARQVADGLAAAHARGVVHRDLKPENLLFSRSGVVKIADFGLARFEGPDPRTLLTSDGRVVGTPAYMAPEQAKGGRADKRSDVFAFGAVFFELCVGRPLFQGSTMFDLFASISAYRGPDRAALAPHGAFGEVIARCLALAPQERFGDAVELAVAVASCDAAGPAFARTELARP